MSVLQSVASSFNIEPASWTWGFVRPNVIHFPSRDFVLLSQRAFSGLGSMGVEVGWELQCAGDVEKLEDWVVESRIDIAVWTVLEQGIRGGMVEGTLKAV